MIKYKSPLLTLLPAFLVVILIIAPLIGWREISIGDTGNYTGYFNRIAAGDTSSGFEFGFHWLSLGISRITQIPSIYFYTICSIVSLNLLLCMALLYRYFGYSNRWHFALFALPLLIASSWYFTSVSNGLRQGISLSFLYVGAILFFLQKKRLAGFILMALSVSFHYTSIFAVASVVALSYFGIIPIFAIYALFLFGYVSGANQHIVKLFSDLSSIDLHGMIERYSGGRLSWYGLQWDLFVYTVFWLAIYICSRKLIMSSYIKEFDRIVSLYMSLSLPYFILGFGSFSNRWAFMAWLFLPILHFSALVLSRFSNVTKVAFSIVLLGVGGFKFLGLLRMI